MKIKKLKKYLKKIFLKKEKETNINILEENKTNILEENKTNINYFEEHKRNLFWQYPVITEKTFYNQNKNNNNYVGIPWATLIDKYDLDDCYNNLQKNKNFNKNSDNLYTCCQHISFRRLIKIWKILGIKTVYCPHKIKGEDFIDEIQIKPCPLYAVNFEDETRNSVFKEKDFENSDRKYLFSFAGSYKDFYLSDIRKRIFKLKNKYDNTLILDTGDWHFNCDVYDKSQNIEGTLNEDENHKKKTDFFNQLLLDSRFTLCPSGSGPNSIRLSESLACGSIPVLLADTLELPYHNLWDQAIVFLKEDKLENIHDILTNINHETETKMRKNCLKIYNDLKNNYLNEIKKLGTNYGGWITPIKNNLDHNSIIYSGGVGEDISFDLILSDMYNPFIYLIDPTTKAVTHYNDIIEYYKNKDPNIFNGKGIQKDYISCIKELKPNFNKINYINKGIWDCNTELKFFKPKIKEHVSCSLISNVSNVGKEYDIIKTKTIKQIMLENNHSKIDLLKLDIEGAEIKTLNKMLDDKIFPNYLLIEFDLKLNNADKNNITDTLINRLKNYYNIIIDDNYNITFELKNMKH